MKKKKNAPGAALEAADGKVFSLISDETLLALYGNLLRARALNEYSAGRAGSLAGFEAVQVGVAMDLGPGDTVQSSAADPLPRFLFGQPLKQLLARSVAESNPLNQLHEALGSALHHKTSKDGKVTILYWSEGDSEPWIAALEAARVYKLPILFVNQSALEGRSGDQKLSRKTPLQNKSLPGAEMPHIAVDGADTVAVYRVAHESIERARRDRGPTLIDCRVYRVQGERRRPSDSIRNMEAYLRTKGLLTSGMKQQVLESFASDLKRALPNRGSRSKTRKSNRQA